jgi:hypothetical protein
MAEKTVDKMAEKTVEKTEFLQVWKWAEQLEESMDEKTARLMVDC